MANKSKKSNGVKNTTERVVLKECGLDRTVEVGKNKYTMISTEDEVFSGSES
ncbi:MAG: hypothetical protein IKC64_05445 [Clostridia bacterium]|nr:hypothetical protein [Clostridia bacterium]